MDQMRFVAALLTALSLAAPAGAAELALTMTTTALATGLPAPS